MSVMWEYGRRNLIFAALWLLIAAVNAFTGDWLQAMLCALVAFMSVEASSAAALIALQQKLIDRQARVAEAARRSQP